MISRLEGKLNYIDENFILVDINGIGYEIELNLRDINLLPTLGEIIIVYTHMVIREDFQGLYGFLDKQDRDCFRSLIKVSGIGPKMGLSILSSLTVMQLINAIELEDVKVITLANGVGKKMAERLILELKGKISSLSVSYLENNNKNEKPNSFENDLINALIGLGFSRVDVVNAIKLIPKDTVKLDVALKLSLQILGKS
jgi:Holliday junction DNA helicase RuvA